MSASKMKPKGTCYQCGEPVEGKRLFCNKACHGTYYNRNMRALGKWELIEARIEAIGQRNDRREAEHQVDVVNDWSRRAHTVGIHAVRMG